MQSTKPYSDLNLDVTGYMLNASLDSHSQEVIHKLQQKFSDRFGKGIYTLSLNALHITLMDWVAPLVDYGRDKDTLFKDLFPEYDTVLTELLDGVSPINVMFDTIGVSSGAIFLQGHDNGQFQAIRDSFTDHASLVPGTKQPPSIIHTSIARFSEQIDLRPVQEFASGLSVNFTQDIHEFRLVNEKKIPMLEYDLVKLYELNKRKSSKLIN